MVTERAEWRDYYRGLLADPRYVAASTVRVVGLSIILYPFLRASVCLHSELSCTNEEVGLGFFAAAVIVVVTEGYIGGALQRRHQQAKPGTRAGALVREKAWWAAVLERSPVTAVFLALLSLLQLALFAGALATLLSFLIPAFL
jgi:hypothetical protein